MRCHPVRIVAFTAEGRCRDVTADIADELRRRYVEVGEVPTLIHVQSSHSRSFG